MQSARLDVEPRSGNAVLNQLTGYALGRGLGFQAMSVIVTVVLALAANTSFAGCRNAPCAVVATWW
ncbi:MAG: hypothetical protein ACREN4_05990 [Candidatus Dormibacteria bacterium]